MALALRPVAADEQRDRVRAAAPPAAAAGRGPRGTSPRSRRGPSRSSGTMIWSASSKRAKMRSSGSPKARAWPGHSCPAPRPKTKRPPLISSSVSAVLAMMPGLRCSADSTHVPTLTRDGDRRHRAGHRDAVPHALRGLTVPARHRSSSASRACRSPIASARRAIARISGQRVVDRSGPNCIVRQHDPDLEPTQWLPPVCAGLLAEAVYEPGSSGSPGPGEFGADGRLRCTLVRVSAGAHRCVRIPRRRPRRRTDAWISSSGTRRAGVPASTTRTPWSSRPRTSR